MGTVMGRADKNLFRTYATDVSTIARDIGNVAAATKDPESRRMLEKWRDDLQYVTADIGDTLDRL